jgi:hypothetical protein
VFHRKQKPGQVAEGARAQHGATDDATLLTRAEMLATIDLLEKYIQISTDERSVELAGILIVRLLDRLQQVVGSE